ncbi:MAG: glycoside hydrolase family 2 [Prevotella sp.]|nr:glycoside hydrolase family 2 [Prevotella sp.]
MKRLLTALLLALSLGATAQEAPSVAGLFPFEGSGRTVWNFNAGWRFHLGEAAGAEATDYDDTAWPIVSTPHTVQLMPAEASGCRNYQGVAWYRKHFTMPAETAGRHVTLHFEAIMGKQTFYVDGREVKRNEGGYLPTTLDLTQLGINAGDSCVIAVMADNSDDKNYPPGKKQMTLDFAYHGGIYRDVWLISTGEAAITEATEADRPAGGGIFVHYADITERAATVFVDVEVKNHGQRARTVTVENSIEGLSGRQTASARLQPGESKTLRSRFVVKNPHLWSPESPYLYNIRTRVSDGRQPLDGGITRIGIRSFEFKGADGFWLNGQRYHQLVGANRHQDFAYVGNALPNSQQWRDAKRLRDAGFTIIRTAHYPQDPAFMDACDELGLFVIVATPGWQYWNKDPQFAQKVQQNTRRIIRRDRNHPSVLMWEPILNETRFPEQFALDALQVTRDEYPYPYRPVAAADVHSAGVADHYDVVYGWPGDDFKSDRPRQCIFTREFGELVDDWYAHNNLNRASRSWGERPQLMQAQSLFRSADELYHTTGQFIGGCQWHPFDHQRGYHPDPYWGGIYDAFRQPKTAFWMFAATLAPQTGEAGAQAKPIVHIAHEMTQFSDADVTVYSNCDSVRLTMYDGAHQWTQPVRHEAGHAPSQPVVFKNAWDFFEARNYSYTQRNWQRVKMVAEGISGGRTVCTDTVMPSRRSTRLRLTADELGKPLTADGSDFIVVVCEVTDDNGHVRRLAKEHIRFTVEGEGEIIGDATIAANPRATEWGSAPVLIRATRKAGRIKVRAEVQYPGTHAPTAAELELQSVAPAFPFCHTEQQALRPAAAQAQAAAAQPQLTEEQRNQMLHEVEAQQADFGIQK